MTEPLSDRQLQNVRDMADEIELDGLEGVAAMLDALLAEVARLKAENADLRRELDAATAALEAQGQAAFVAGMRRKAMAEGEDER